jgi:hypothetical protein
MTRNRMRLGYWRVDLRQLIFWVTVALVVGAIPDLAVNVHWLLLFSIWVIAIVVATLIWLRDERKLGVGVYVHLPRRGEGALSDHDLLANINKKIGKNHRDWFRAGPDIGKSDLKERIDWIVGTIEHRLGELQVRADHQPATYLYLHCRLPEAFALGKKVAAVWNKVNPLVPVRDHHIEPVELNLSLVVRGISTYKKNIDIFGLDFDKLGQPEESRDAALTLEVHDLRDPTASGQTPRLALIVQASERGNFQAFKEQALRAASGASPGGYRILESDVCDRAITVSIPADSLFSSLRQDDGEKFIRQMLAIRSQHSMEWYGSEEIPVRVFMDAPVIFSFAAGALLPSGSELVPFDIRRLQESLSDSSQLGATNTHEIVAIVDGDDVGTGMERSLLAGDIAAATQYSLNIDASLNKLVNEAQSVPGVTLVSSGGDSAIFGLPGEALYDFREVLEKLRDDDGLKFSCGYGADCREAFYALRVAKTSGKNKTAKYR